MKKVKQTSNSECTLDLNINRKLDRRYIDASCSLCDGCANRHVLHVRGGFSAHLGGFFSAP